MITSRPAGSRRVVRRVRPALDAAYDVALAELPIELRPAVIAYAEAKKAEYTARQMLGTEMSRTGTRWRDIDAVTSKIIYSGSA